MPNWTREKVESLDQADPLAEKRRLFHLPEGLIYLDGNSLGPRPEGVAARLTAVVEDEWGEGLIRSWNAAEWIELPQRVGAKLAPIIGARPGEVIACDSTSVNLFKVLMAALTINKGRQKIVTEAGNFPTDNYIIRSVASLSGLECLARPADQLLEAVDADTACLVLTHVNYRTGEFYDLEATTRKAHDKGALVIWDLSHSAGAMPLDLDRAGVDFAVGCGYKFLNGGPGAPAYLFVAEALHDKVEPVLSGWMGHARPFDFADDYEPAAGIDRNLCGTPGILGMAALDAALDAFADVDMEEVRRKSMQLGDLLVDLVEDQCADHGFSVISPHDATMRASQVSIAHPQGYAIMQALISKGVIGDYRDPEVMRFGITPLYLRFIDLWHAVRHLRRIMEKETWRRPEFSERHPVT
ncbi:MAG: kynureninase [Alphaproteobacteria bacterium]